MSLVNQGEFSLAVVVLRTGGGGRGIPYVPRGEQMQGIQRNCMALRQKASFGAVRLHLHLSSSVLCVCPSSF